MLKFTPNEPFPLLESSSHTYLEAQIHAAAVDAWLGLETEKIEKTLASQGCRARATGSMKVKQELWIGLAVKSLLTPYTEIRSLLKVLDPKAGETVVDLGAGYGRMGFVIARHYPQVHFVGYEYVGERVQESQRCLAHLKPGLVKMEHADLSSIDFTPQEADYYFIYDFGTPKAIEKTLHDLRRIAQRRTITVVGRGRSSRDIIERHHPWLSQVVQPRHFAHSSIYRSA